MTPPADDGAGEIEEIGEDEADSLSTRPPPSRRRTVHVKHPILRLEIIGPQGTRAAEHHVFCRLQQKSISVGICCACTHCDAIVSVPSPSVNCTVLLEERDLEPDPLGTHTPVGNMLEHGAISIDPTLSVHEALKLLQSEGVQSVAVVDGEHRMVGVLHEAVFVRGGMTMPSGTARAPRARGEVLQIMSASLAIHESLPIRRALELLAAAHLREATVVNAEGIPIGVFRDIDGLRWMFTAKQKHA